MKVMGLLERRWLLTAVAAFEVVGIAALVAQRRAAKRATRRARVEQAIHSARERLPLRNGAGREKRIALLIHR